MTLADKLLPLCQLAGAAIMEVYRQPGDVAVERKSDNTPVTQADHLANSILCAGLEQLEPDTPIISEENKALPLAERQQWPRYWLIDPLDGTKEFINGTGEFCCCIALMENQQPSFGFIYAPATNEAWWGGINCPPMKLAKGQQIPLPCGDSINITMVASHRGYMLSAVCKLIEQLENALGPVTRIELGSALKYCQLAEGSGHIYPSLGLTSEWDSAAGQAILAASGGQIVTRQDQALKYNQSESLLNPPFYALSGAADIQKRLSAAIFDKKSV
ncbi:MAG: 3'(2'),5'-bisphosphate nucleotidase CysQ [Pseudomonadales bacterium]